MASFGSTNAPWTHSFPSAKLVATAFPACLDEGTSAREGWRGAREAMRTLAKWVGTAVVARPGSLHQSRPNCSRNQLHLTWGGGRQTYRRWGHRLEVPSSRRSAKVAGQHASESPARRILTEPQDTYHSPLAVAAVAFRQKERDRKDIHVLERFGQVAAELRRRARATVSIHGPCRVGSVS